MQLNRFRALSMPHSRRALCPHWKHTHTHSHEHMHTQIKHRAAYTVTHTPLTQAAAASTVGGLCYHADAQFHRRLYRGGGRVREKQPYIPRDTPRGSCRRVFHATRQTTTRTTAWTLSLLRPNAIFMMLSTGTSSLYRASC